MNEVQPTFREGLKSSFPWDSTGSVPCSEALQHCLFQSFLTASLCVVILCFPCWRPTDRLCFYSLAKLPINPVSLIQFIKVGAVVPARANHSGPVINHWNAFVETKKWTWTDLKPVGKDRRSNDRCDRSKVWKRWLLLMNLWSLEVKSRLMRDEQKICAARWTHWGGGAWFVSIL